MDPDNIDTILLHYVNQSPGKSYRFYASRFWNEHTSLSRAGAIFRLERLKAHGFVTVSQINNRLCAISLTDQGRQVISSGVLQA